RLRHQPHRLADDADGRLDPVPAQPRGAALRGGTLRRTRTATRAGRAGTSNERKSRTAPAISQYGHASACVGGTAPGGGATGASHAGQASVAVATCALRASRPSSRHLATCSTGASRSGPVAECRRDRATWRVYGAVNPARTPPASRL